MTARSLLEERELELSRPAGNAHARWLRRNSVLLTLLDDEGRRGHGEATPLEGFATDSFAAARAELARASAESVDDALSARTPAEALARIGTAESPSARFALHSAVLSLRAARAGHARAEELARLVESLGVAPSTRRIVPGARAAAELLDLDSELERELALARARTQTFKVKLGRDPRRELERLRQLIALLSPGERLRLDANGALPDTEELSRLSVEFGALIELVEEPLASLGAPRPLAFPLALDETLFRDPALARRWLAAGRVTAVVLKPMALGLLETLRWAALARAHDTEVIVSHCFDGAVAHAHYLELASLIGSPRLAMGLGAHPGLALWQEVVG